MQVCTDNTYVVLFLAVTVADSQWCHFFINLAFHLACFLDLGWTVVQNDNYIRYVTVFHYNINYTSGCGVKPYRSVKMVSEHRPVSWPGYWFIVRWYRTSADFCQTLISCLHLHIENPTYLLTFLIGYLLFHCTCNHYFSINWTGIELYKLPPDLFNVQRMTISVRCWLDWFPADSIFSLCTYFCWISTLTTWFWTHLGKSFGIVNKSGT